MRLFDERADNRTMKEVVNALLQEQNEKELIDEIFKRTISHKELLPVDQKHFWLSLGNIIIVADRGGNLIVESSSKITKNED